VHKKCGQEVVIYYTKKSGVAATVSKKYTQNIYVKIHRNVVYVGTNFNVALWIDQEVLWL